MLRSRPMTLLALLISVGLLLAACGGTTPSATADGGGGTTPSATADGGESGDTVSLSGGTFSPGGLTVSAGTTVTFTGTSGHTVTEGSNGTATDDPIVDAAGGADIEVTLDQPGTYQFTCKIHPNMNMTITVEG